jgi:hypothetical protein
MWFVFLIRPGNMILTHNVCACAHMCACVWVVCVRAINWITLSIMHCYLPLPQLHHYYHPRDCYRLNRIEYKKGGHISDPCTLTVLDLLFSSYINACSSLAPWTKCTILLIDMSLRSPGLIKCWPRCVNLNVAKVLQSQRKCEALSDANLYLSHLGLFISSSLNRCPCLMRLLSMVYEDSNWRMQIYEPT